MWINKNVQVWTGGVLHTDEQFSGYQLGVLQVNTTLTLSTQRQYQSPPIKGSVLQDASHKPRFFLSGYYKQEVPKKPSSGSIILLEELTEHRETFYLLDHWLFVKGCNSGAARQRGRRGKAWGKGRGAPMPSPATSDSQHLHMVTSPESLCTLSFWASVEASSPI